MPGFGVRRRDEPREPVVHQDWRPWSVPCGESFVKEQDASWHYLECRACSVAHRKRGFRQP
jgi:hypothetical protein